MKNIFLSFSFYLFLLFIKAKQSDDYDFSILKAKNSSICDLKITTEKFIIFEKCILSDEWKLHYEKSSSKNALEVYENKEATRRVFNIEYVIDTHKSQQDIKFNNITIEVFDNNNYINNINISNSFPLTLRKGDNFDVIVEYDIYNLTYVDLIVSIFMINNIDSKEVDLNFGYKKIVTDEFIKKIDLSYLFLTIIFLIFVFLLRLRFLIEENQFIKIHIDEIIQGQNAEKIFVVVGIVLTIFLFFIIIKYIYYITFIFSILLAILSVKSFFKYLFKSLIPSIAALETKYLKIKKFQVDYSNIIFYPLSIAVIIIWYNITDDYFYLHTFLNDIIFFIIVYFNVHKLNLKNFYVIMVISFTVIVYQFIKIILDEKIKQEDDNVYYITTRFIIDAPIRFILKDLINSPFEEIYFFSLLDIVLIGFVIHYCEDTYHLSKIYLMISIYGTIIGLIINMIIFYGFNFSPPMAIIPLFINIVSLIIYSIYQKQFFDFVDLESKELNELEEIVKIQDIQDIPAQIDFLKRNDFNISFNGDKVFEEEKNLDDLNAKRNENDSDEEEKKRHENIMNNLSDKFNYNAKDNKISPDQVDSDMEGVEKIIKMVGSESEQKLETPIFPTKKSKKLIDDLNMNNNPNSNNSFSKKEEPKMVEMKIFEDKSD